MPVLRIPETKYLTRARPTTRAHPPAAECLSCQKRFTTYEAMETTPMMALKKDGSLKPSTEQLLNSMLRRCQKRKVSLAQIEKR